MYILVTSSVFKNCTPLCANFLQRLHTLNVVTILIICQRNLCPGAAGDSDSDVDCDCETLQQLQQQKELKKFAAAGFVGFFCSANPIFLIVCRSRGSERGRAKDEGEESTKCVCAGGG